MHQHQVHISAIGGIGHYNILALQSGVELSGHLPLTGFERCASIATARLLWSHRTAPPISPTESRTRLVDCHVADKPSGWQGYRSSSRPVPSYALTHRPQSALLHPDLGMHCLGSMQPITAAARLLGKRCRAMLSAPVSDDGTGAPAVLNACDDSADRVAPPLVRVQHL